MAGYGCDMGRSPLDAHAATPLELRERLRAEAAGAPFLVYRDADDGQVIVELDGGRGRLTIGRDEASDVPLTWDGRVSRTHAALERIGADWTVEDDGLSRNGTRLNGERVTGRRRLRSGDVLLVGDTPIAFVAGASVVATPTLSADGPPPADVLTPAQRRVLVALCRPYRDGGFAAPASNPAIARELSVSVEAVKTTLRALFELFGVPDLPQNQKRASLAQQALRSGAVTRREL
jgi:pSer/pThr/pTyr-binding forkhead associated (FHA) protein